MKQATLSPAAERAAAPADLIDLDFDNSFVRELPADPLLDNVPRAVRNACYTRVEPTPVPSPQLLGWSDAVGAMSDYRVTRATSVVDPTSEQECWVEPKKL